VTLLGRSHADEDDNNDGDGNEDDGQCDGQDDHRALVFQSTGTADETVPSVLDLLQLDVGV